MVLGSKVACWAGPVPFGLPDHEYGALSTWGANKPEWTHGSDTLELSPLSSSWLGVEEPCHANDVLVPVSGERSGGVVRDVWCAAVSMSGIGAGLGPALDCKSAILGDEAFVDGRAHRSLPGDGTADEVPLMCGTTCCHEESIGEISIGVWEAVVWHDVDLVVCCSPDAHGEESV